jgi:hypothetical protein
MTEAILPIVREAAQSSAEFVSLEAIHLIDDMDNDAQPIWDVVEWVHKNQQGYPARIADYLLTTQPSPR